MLNFYYSVPTEIFFGENQIKVLGEQIKKYRRINIIVYGGGSIKATGIYEEVVKF